MARTVARRTRKATRPGRTVNKALPANNQEETAMHQAHGSQPEDAAHPDVRAALAALDGLKFAEFAADFDPETDEPDAGVCVEPREEGRILAYWFTGEGHLSHAAGMDAVCDRLRAAGWTVERRPLVVSAQRPAA
ncbi:hypothetical protein [Streptomyces sp. NPDC056683]|uniref:hypothetical protein n=1 Tax=Streptomyces sp. NPDC056683 TaxID=3345910 RepID=UPI0036A46C44